MKKDGKLLLYEKATIEIVRFEAGDCISTSDMSFGENEGWDNNMPGNGWI